MSRIRRHGPSLHDASVLGDVAAKDSEASLAHAGVIDVAQAAPRAVEIEGAAHVVETGRSADASAL
jgi:hypothetical protein